MANSIKMIPSVGDIMIIVDGEKRFVNGADATKAFIDTQQAVGVVYDVHGRVCKIVGGVNNVSKKWSQACDFEITAIPSDSGTYAVKLNNTAMGDFTYTKSTGTKTEFVNQLNTWLATNAQKWEAYMEDDDTAILQMSTYDAYENTCTIAGCTLSKRVGTEVAAYDNLSCYDEQGHYHYGWGLGMCRQRIEEYCKTQTRAECNPTSRLDGVTQIMGTLPCSETYFNGELGDGLRANFANYQEYIDACMIHVWELGRGLMQYRDGKFFTDLLADKKLLIRGSSTPAYSAAYWAKTYDSGVEGYGAGTFWLPSMHELSILMRNVTVGTTKAVDPVNVALSKRTGWSQISSTSDRWSACRYNSCFAWYDIGNGCTNDYSFYGGWAVSAVSAFEF